MRTVLVGVVVALTTLFCGGTHEAAWTAGIWAMKPAP
jgi:hypothetical protein